MNRYGTMAMEHWQTHRPRQYAAIPDPTGFFTTLGEQMAAQVTTVSLALAGDDPGDETFLAKVGRLNMARLRAEEQVMRQMLPAAEDETTDA
jgi:hypothetical protein